MDPDRQPPIERTEALFNRVVRLAPSDQDAVLDEQAVIDPGLSISVRRLLTAHRAHPLRAASSPDAIEADSGSIVPRTPSRAVDAAASLAPGALIGNFEIVRLVGGGSAAEVFEARRIGPVAQRVALKILRPGMGSIDLRARFEEERERLAQFDHPGIAALVDADTTPDGRPWFAMHFVGGAPITSYCDDRSLTVSARVDLLRQVCEALAYAHRRGVVHRDVTPSNILVTEIDGQRRAVVVDFGIAKALNQSRGVNSELPLHRKILGTPSYMAPEQTRPGAPLGPPADVFGVGSLMTELLVGFTPLDIESLDTPSLDVVFADVRSRERPSLAAVLRRQKPHVRETIATHRGTTPPKLARLVDRELQWIASHCLDLNPDQRYESAEPLGRDLDRWLRGELPSVGPRSALTRFRSLARRHRVAAGIALFVAILLAAATIVSTYFALSERAARQLADEREITTQRVSDFQAGILRNLDLAAAGRQLNDRTLSELRHSLTKREEAGPETERLVADVESALASINSADVARGFVRDALLEPAIAEIDRRFVGQPVIAAQMLQSVAATYARLGMPEEAVMAQARALDLLQQALGPDTMPAVDAALTYAVVLFQARRACEAEPTIRNAIEVLDRDPSRDPALLGHALRLYATALVDSGRIAEAERTTARALDLVVAVHGRGHFETIGCRNQLAQHVRRSGRLDDALHIFLEALSDHRRLTDKESALSAIIQMEVGYTFELKKDFTQAVAWYRRGWDTRRQIFGDNHFITQGSLSSISLALAEQGRLDEAATVQQEIVARAIASDADYNEHSRAAIGALASLYDKLHQARPDEGFDRRAAAWRTFNEEWRAHPRQPPPMTMFDSLLKPAPSSNPIPTPPTASDEARR